MPAGSAKAEATRLTKDEKTMSFFGSVLETSPSLWRGIEDTRWTNGPVDLGQTETEIDASASWAVGIGRSFD
jgi:hypothetical protein